MSLYSLVDPLRSQFEDGGGAGDAPGTPAAPQTNIYTGTTAPAAAPVKTGGGAGAALAGPAFDPSIGINFGHVPAFTAPQFKAPTLDDALAEPGYAFRAKAGTDAIEHSAAAAGLLRSGGTFKDLADWSGKNASQEYGNVYNRALSSFDRLYQGRHDEYAPRLAEWTTNANAKLQAAIAEKNLGWNMYAFSHPSYEFSHQYHAGAGVPGMLGYDDFIAGGAH